MRVLLISTYDMGRSPTSVASAAAFLSDAGAEVTACDLARCRLDKNTVAAADLIAFSLPMHTATRMALDVIERVSELNPNAKLCAFGLYAPLNADLLHARGIDVVLGAESEADLAALVRGEAPKRGLPKLHFLPPRRDLLPDLAGYAQLCVGPGQKRVVGTTDTTRGCKHHCRHCPLPVVYKGAFRVVQRDVVLADIATQVAMGAQHITFGDPDFLNGPGHALRIVEAMHHAHPDLTFDATIKVEHLLKHRTLLPRLEQAGCLFITTAVEAFDDVTLDILNKGHTQTDFLLALQMTRAHGIWLSPTFLPFTPWTTLETYLQFLRTLDTLELVDQVAPVQLSIRLLLMGQSPLVQHPAVAPALGDYNAEQLAWQWTHPDSRMDALQQDITTIVAQDGDRRTLYSRVLYATEKAAGASSSTPKASSARSRTDIPYLNEPWFC